MEELAPLQHFNRIVYLWWILLAAALLGGGAGFLISRSHAPIYEAYATFSVNIDLDKVPEHPLQLHDEDLALATTQAVLTSPAIIENVLANANKLGHAMDTTTLISSSSIERRLAFWILRFRSSDPTFAQALVNLWAEEGYKAMLDWQANGQAPAYVIFSPPTVSGVPAKPVYYDTNKLVLWGSFAGFLLSILMIEIIANRPRPLRPS